MNYKLENKIKTNIDLWVFCKKNSWVMCALKHAQLQNVPAILGNPKTREANPICPYGALTVHFISLHQLNVRPMILVFHCGFGCSKDAVLQSSHWRPVMLQYETQPHPNFLNKTKPTQNYSNKSKTFWINANKGTQIYTYVSKFSIRLKFDWEKMESNSNLSIKHIYPSQSN